MIKISDMKEFLDSIGSEGKSQIKDGLQKFLENVVNHLDDEEEVI